jgi:glycine/D-amino acid oxidase-like deaminating enzyme
LRRTSGRQIVASVGNEDIDADHVVIATGASSVPLQPSDSSPETERDALLA